MSAANTIDTISSDVSYIIQGGSKLNGIVHVSGAKNSILKLLPAAMLSSGEVIISNVPTKLYDVITIINLLQSLGTQIVETGSERLLFRSSDSLDISVMKQSTSIRVTYLLVPFQLKRYGLAFMPRPAGCAFAERKYDFHLGIWAQMGASVEDNPNDPFITIKAPNGGLKGTEIVLQYRSVGATETALLSGAIANGVTTVRNAYVTPEFYDLVSLLEMMGVNIHINGTSEVVIEGCDEFSGCSVKVIPDRIEAVTWVVLAAVSKGRITIKNFPSNYLTVPMAYFDAMGIPLALSGDTCIVDTIDVEIEGQEIVGGSYPGIITDMLPIFSVLGLHAKGSSRIIDVRYPDRFQYFDGLQKMGAKVNINKNGEVFFYGPQTLHGAEVVASDLRGGASLLLAGAVAQGWTRIRNMVQVLRGYNLLEEKLRSIGVDFKVESF